MPSKNENDVANAITLLPADPIAGAPITVNGETRSQSILVVRNLDLSGKSSFQMELDNTKPDFSQQFAIYEPGNYRIEIGDRAYSFQVRDAPNVSMLGELGLVVSLVLAILGGLIGWSFKKRNQNAGAGSF